MPTVTQTTRRLELNQSSRLPAVEQLSQNKLVLWQGLSAEIECALFNDTPKADSLITDISNIDTANLVVRKIGPKGDILFTEEVTVVQETNYADWLNEVGRHFVFAVSDLDTTQIVPASGRLPIYFVVTVTTTAGVPYIAGFGYGEIVDVGYIENPVSTDYIDGRTPIVGGKLLTDFDLNGHRLIDSASGGLPEDGEVVLTADQLTVSVNFVLQKSGADVYRFDYLYIKDTTGVPRDVRPFLNSQSTTGFVVQLTAGATVGSILYWKVIPKVNAPVVLPVPRYTLIPENFPIGSPSGLRDYLGAPKIFNVAKDYGAKGDTRRVVDANITVGQATLTSTTAAFVPDDVGKKVCITDAGVSGAPLVATIITRTNATTVTLGTAAGATVANQVAMIGTDDTTSILSALADALALAHGKIYFPITGTPTGTYFYTAPLVFPAWSTANDTIAITLEGENHVATNYTFGADFNVAPSRSSVIFNPSSKLVTFTPFSSGITNISFRAKNLVFRSIDNPRYRVIDAEYANYCILKNCLIDTNKSGAQATPTHTDAIALYLPRFGNNAMEYTQNLLISGYYVGCVASDFARGDNVIITHCAVGLRCLYAPFGSVWGQLGLYHNIIQCQFTEERHVFTAAKVTLERYNAAYTTDSNFATVTDFDDPSNYGRGRVPWISLDGPNEINLAINGGMYLTFHSNRSTTGFDDRGLALTDAKIIGSLAIGASLYNTGTVSIPHAVVTPIPFDAERSDTDGLHSLVSNTDRITIVRTGRYFVEGHASFEDNSVGFRALSIRWNALDPGAIIGSPQKLLTIGGDIMPLQVFATWDFAAGDVIYLCAYQTSGGALNLARAGRFTPELRITRLS